MKPNPNYATAEYEIAEYEHPDGRKDEFLFLRGDSRYTDLYFTSLEAFGWKRVFREFPRRATIIHSVEAEVEPFI